MWHILAHFINYIKRGNKRDQSSVNSREFHLVSFHFLSFILIFKLITFLLIFFTYDSCSPLNTYVNNMRSTAGNVTYVPPQTDPEAKRGVPTLFFSNNISHIPCNLTPHLSNLLSDCILYQHHTAHPHQPSVLHTTRRTRRISYRHPNIRLVPNNIQSRPSLPDTDRRTHIADSIYGIGWLKCHNNINRQPPLFPRHQTPAHLPLMPSTFPNSCMFIMNSTTTNLLNHTPLLHQFSTNQLH